MLASKRNCLQSALWLSCITFLVFYPSHPHYEELGLEFRASVLSTWFPYKKLQKLILHVTA